MNKVVVFFLGLICGIVLTFIVSTVLNNAPEQNEAAIWFDTPGECLSTKPFEVMQVLGKHQALCYEVKWNELLKRYIATDLLVLLVNDNEEYYYDDQLIKVPKGKCMRQVGIYRYETKAEDMKTVPIVKIMDL